MPSIFSRFRQNPTGWSQLAVALVGLLLLIRLTHKEGLMSFARLAPPADRGILQEGEMTYRADQATDQARGWNDYRPWGEPAPRQSPAQLAIVPRSGQKPRTFSGKVIVHGSMEGVEVGLISLVGVHWIDPDAYQWQPVAADGSFSITDARYLDADKALAVRGPDTPWTFLRRNFGSGEEAKNIVLEADPPLHVRLTASGGDGANLTDIGCEIFPYAQYDDRGNELRRQRMGEIDSAGKDHVDLVLPPDRIALFVGAPGYARFYQVIDPRKASRFHFVLERAGAMKIHVVDNDGKPKGGLHVQWQSDEAPLSLSGSVVGPDGTMLAEGLTPATFVVSVEGFADQVVVVKPDAVAELTLREGSL